MRRVCSKVDFVGFCKFVVGERQRLLLTSNESAPQGANRSRVFHHNKFSDGVVSVTSQSAGRGFESHLLFGEVAQLVEQPNAERQYPEAIVPQRLIMSRSGRKGYFLVRLQGWKKFLPADWSATPCKCSRLSKFGQILLRLLVILSSHGDLKNLPILPRA